MSTQLEKLHAKVKARNQANKLANDVFPSIVESLKPFIGFKVCKVDGTLFEKIKSAMPKAPNNHPNLSSYYTTGHGYDLCLCLKTCVNLDGCAYYADITVYLAKITNGVLEKIHDAPDLRSDYTEEEIIAARNEVTNARQALSKAESKLTFFGEHDNG